MDEVMEEFRDSAQRDTFFLRQNLTALETILDEPQPPGTLLQLAEWDANWSMDHDPTNDGAAVFLRRLAEMLRSAIEEEESGRWRTSSAIGTASTEEGDDSA
ncbi:hypothetical protein [Actinoplanes derwentensis]|uniref:hypothetical protein n=1 Tax=Actinoplanes derwentensis TaxID=113562 RepID=UPI0012FD2443|nr:hypothetical protein [Actinoplanes derwentensis]